MRNATLSSIVRPEAGTGTGSTPTVQEGPQMLSVTSNSQVVITRLFRTLAIGLLVCGAFAQARDFEFEPGSVPAAPSGAAAATEVGISCSHDGAATNTQQWSGVYAGAKIELGFDNLVRISLFNEDGSSATCDADSDLKISALTTIDLDVTQTGLVYVVTTAGHSGEERTLSISRFIDEVLGRVSAEPTRAVRPGYAALLA